MKVKKHAAVQHAGPNNREDSQGEPLAKRTKIKTFLQSWMLMPEFSGWLQPVKNEPEKAFCTYCQKKLKCGKSEFMKHASTYLHYRQAPPTIIPAEEENPAPQSEVEDEDTHKKAVKSAETKLSAFFAKHNIGAQTVEYLVPLIKDCFKDSIIAQDITLGRKKCTQIKTKNCLSKRALQTLVDALRVQKFSVLVDESTDTTDTKSLCILVQFVSLETKKVVTELLELIELDARNNSAESEYATFKSFLASKGIPITNIVGIAADNVTAMTGVQNSFMIRLKSEAPCLVVFNCICHSSALIASKACESLPRFCEDLIRSVATYESASAKRTAVLRTFQELLDVETQKIVKVADTKWISMHNCVVLLLNNWDALQMFFALAVKEDDLKATEIILANFNNETVKAYFYFLKYSLNFFNSFNALFQSRKILIHKLTESSRLLISQFGGNCFKRQVLNELMSGSLNIANPQNYLALDLIILGPECERLLAVMPSNGANEIRASCLSFYITAVMEMARRLPLQQSFLDDFRFLAPRVALNFEDRGRARDLSGIAERFGKFDLTKLAFEWNSLPSAFTDEKKQSLITLDVDAFWKEVLQFQNLAEEKMFPILEQIVDIVLSLPHSNAEAERIFSMVHHQRL